MDLADIEAWVSMGRELSDHDRADVMGKIMGTIEMSEVNVTRFLLSMSREQCRLFLRHAVGPIDPRMCA